MKKRLIALTMALAMVFALGVNAVSADDAEKAEPVVAAPATVATKETEETAETSNEPAPDAEGTLSFANLRGRMLENYYPLLALEENIQTLEEWDYKRTEDELRDLLNETANRQFGMIAGDITGLGIGSMMAASLQPQYNAYRDAFDDVRDGKLQEDNEGVKRQLRNLQNQTVIVAESLYITRKGLEAQDAALTRTIAALERTEQEMTLRQKMGQISALALQQISAGRVQAQSGQATLRMNMDNILLQLKAMTATELDASLTLGELPKVTAQQLADMDLDADLAKAKEVSYALYDAKKTYDDAKADYNDALKEYGTYSKKNEWMQAKHTWQAAQYTYEDAKQSYELKFRMLYAQVKDAAQILEAKRVSLASQEKSYKAAALKYEQGSISANALKDAGDELAQGKDEVATAERDLFTQYRSYCWAVEYGILNS